MIRFIRLLGRIESRKIIDFSTFYLGIFCYEQVVKMKGMGVKMARCETFRIEIDGSYHIVNCEIGLFHSKFFINGFEYPLRNRNFLIPCIDQSFDIGDKTLHLTVLGSKIDLAIDEVYMKSRKPYVPLQIIPRSANMLTFLLIIVSFIFGGIVCAFLGLGAGQLIFRNYVSQHKKNNNFLYCMSMTIIIAFVNLVYFITMKCFFQTYGDNILTFIYSLLRLIK